MTIGSRIRTFFCGDAKPNATVAGGAPTKIQEVLAGIETIFERAMRHSRAYQNVIGLRGDDRDAWNYIPGANPIMTLSIMDENFRLETNNLCCAHYRWAESWQTIVQTRATTNHSLNMTVGGGTAEFNIVPDEWHERIIAVLTVGRLDDVGYEFHYEGETLLMAPHDDRKPYDEGEDE